MLPFLPRTHYSLHLLTIGPFQLHQVFFLMFTGQTSHEKNQPYTYTTSLFFSFSFLYLPRQHEHPSVLQAVPVITTGHTRASLHLPGQDGDAGQLSNPDVVTQHVHSKPEHPFGILIKPFGHSPVGICIHSPFRSWQTWRGLQSVGYWKKKKDNEQENNKYIK